MSESTNQNENTAPIQPAMVLGAYCQSLVAGRLVAILGDGSSGLGRQLSRATSRHVFVYDPDAQRAAACLATSSKRSDRKVSFGVLDEQLLLRTGAFDAIIIPDLSIFHDQAEILAQAHSLLNGSGIAIIACPKDRPSRGPGKGEPSQGVEHLDYYQLYDLLAAEFDCVRMLGQAPFLGYTVADFAAGDDPAVTIDTSLMTGTEQPEQFIALTSDRPTQTDAYTLIEVPLAAGSRWLRSPGPGSAAQPEAVRAKLAEAQLQTAALRSELDKLRERQLRDAKRAEQRLANATALGTRVAELEGEIDGLKQRLKAATREAADAGKLSREAGVLRHKLEQARQERAELEARLKAAAERPAATPETDQTIARLRQEIAALRQEIAAGQAELARLHEQAAHATELAEELARLREQAAYATELAEELARLREQAAYATELEEELEQARKALADALDEGEALRAEAASAAALEAELEREQAARQQAESIGAQLAQQHSCAADEEQHGAEISRLEQTLQERGRRIAELEEALRESERIGRELVAELAAARAAGGLTAAPAGAPGGAEVEELRGRVESLLHECARYEADLQAAHWQIQALETELYSRQPDSAPQQPLTVTRGSLRREISQLRAQLAKPDQPDGE